MIKPCVFAFAAALAFATAVGAQPSPNGIATNPEWLHKPTGDDIAASYPRAARDNHKSGVVTMRCTVTANGELTACEIVGEDPAGWDFGAATLGLAPNYRMKPKTPDGRSVAGAVVTIPLHWMLR
jgi:protein TonB